MKIVLCCCTLLLTQLLSAQSSYQVINGYTLEPLDSFTVVTDSTMSTISRNGFISKTVPADQLIYGHGLNIVLQPTPEHLKEEHEGSDYYGVPIETKSVDIYDDGQAEYPGGIPAMRKFLANTIRYPEDALEYEISGKVYVQFIVKDDGSMTNIVIIRGLTRSMDAECVRVIRAMPNWEPKKVGGKAVSSAFVLPINFSLQ